MVGYWTEALSKAQMWKFVGGPEAQCPCAVAPGESERELVLQASAQHRLWEACPDPPVPAESPRHPFFSPPHAALMTPGHEPLCSVVAGSAGFPCKGPGRAESTSGFVGPVVSVITLQLYSKQPQIIHK